MTRTPRPHHSPPPRPRRRPRPPVLACWGLAALIAVTGCSATSEASPTNRPAAAAPHSDTASPSASPVGGHSASPVEGEPGAPVQLSIPSIGVRSEVMRLGLNADGTVEVPPAEKGMTTGWYTGGPVPGARGPAVLIGHNETRNGRAVFHDLKKIAKGADIAVRDERGSVVHFKVTGRETVGKTEFPTERVYGRTKGRVLRLITCDGAFDAQGHPVDNLIVYAIRG
ncbi:class F sortase [Streptomyces sp. NPDC091272]|uniref:class F sortase n=1 Tax=Streptomyces sp. NPDC091272 TaxID=3365981 RepID=UPI0037FCFF80